MKEDFSSQPLGNDKKNPKNKPALDKEYSRIIGTFDGYDVWGSLEKKGCETVGFKDSDKVIAYLIFSDNEISPGVKEFIEIWTDPDYQRRGLAAGLILFVTKKLHVKLFLGKSSIVGLDSRSLLKSLADTGKVTITAGLTGDHADYAKILANTCQNNFELMIESDASPWPLFAGDGDLVEHYSVGVMLPVADFN